MPAGKYSFVIEAGATLNFQFTILSNNEPWDLTGFSARMDIRESTDSPDALISLVDGDGIILGDEEGTVEVEIDAVTTSTFPSGRYVYDLEIESAGGTVWRVIEGKVNVRPEVTQ